MDQQHTWSSLRLLPALLAWSSTVVVLAQEPNCNNLTVTSMMYSAFEAEAMDVDVTNAGPLSFSGPTFSLVNTDGDVIADETQWFFVISPGQQQHRMHVQPGFTLPASPFTGTLVLNYHTGDGDTTCMFPMDAQVLCPPLPCSELQPYVYHGGVPVTSDFDWLITDADNNTVGTGQFHLDSTINQQDIDTLCLPPGEYTLHLQQPELVNGNFTFGLTRNIFTVFGPNAEFDPGTTGHLPFTFYGACTEDVNALVEPTIDGFSLNVQHGMLLLTATNDTPIGSIEVIDPHGRLMATTRASGSTVAIDLRRYASGFYFVRSLDERFTQRFVWHNDF
jgi:hypothetical protein